MKLYLECSMGAAGDMIMGALFELLPDQELFLHRMRHLGLPGVVITNESMTKCGIVGTKMRIHINGHEEHSVDVNQRSTHSHSHSHDDHHEHADTNLHLHENTHSHLHQHYSFQTICDIIAGLDIAENVKTSALSVYKLLGEAEATVHGISLDQIFFHEVGSFDAIVDIVGCCLLFQMLGVTAVEASPIQVGSGHVKCAHGILPVPTPATAEILRGIPIYSGKVRGELCTPTGAAILRHFVHRFGDMEPMTISKIGYGMGAKDFDAANCVRAFLCDAMELNDTVCELRCNLDDMTAEAIGFATEVLFAHGALDVFTTPIYMKKNRPAVMLVCLCTPADKTAMSKLLLENTTTLGVRSEILKRDILKTSCSSIQTQYGEIRVKIADGYGIHKEKPEYEDVRKAAELHQVPFTQVWSAAAASLYHK